MAAIAAATLLYPKSCSEPYQALILLPKKGSEGVVQQSEAQENPPERFAKQFAQQLERLVQNQGLITESSLYTTPNNTPHFHRALNRVTLYSQFITESSRDYKIPADLITAMAIVESEGYPRAVSPKGARGLLQITPETAALFNIKEEELFDPRLNLRTGSAYLLRLMRRFEDPVLALMSYNRGPEPIDRARRSLHIFNKPATLENLTKREDLPEETKNYPLKVLRVYAALQLRTAIQPVAYQKR